jgi:hypothetical protein
MIQFTGFRALPYHHRTSQEMAHTMLGQPQLAGWDHANSCLTSGVSSTTERNTASLGHRSPGELYAGRCNVIRCITQSPSPSFKAWHQLNWHPEAPLGSQTSASPSTQHTPPTLQQNPVSAP